MILMTNESVADWIDYDFSSDMSLITHLTCLLIVLVDNENPSYFQHQLPALTYMP